MTDKKHETQEDRIVQAQVIVDESAREPTAEDLGLELPEDPEDAVGYLLEQVHEARTEAAAYLDDLKRVAADFENYRRRATREIGEATQRGGPSGSSPTSSPRWTRSTPRSHSSRPPRRRRSSSPGCIAPASNS